MSVPAAREELPKSPSRWVRRVVATDGADGESVRCPMSNSTRPTATISLTPAACMCATLGPSKAYGGGGVGLGKEVCCSYMDTLGTHRGVYISAHCYGVCLHQQLDQHRLQSLIFMPPGQFV